MKLGSASLECVCLWSSEISIDGSSLAIWCESLRDLMNRFLAGQEKKKKKKWGRKKQNEMVLTDAS